ncbi:MAG TPA: hypothetical protein VEF91_01830 [Verrucomicrobiae bacterium]|nr:hypothetical protein [Verrucomicrobiae bacterium]
MKKRFGKAMLAVLFLSVLTLVVMVTPLVKAQSALLSASSGAAGSSVTVTANGFPADANVFVNFVEPTITLEMGIIVTGSTGSGSATFNVPAGTPAGSYSIKLSSQSSSDVASTPFTVTASTSATSPLAPSATPSPSTSANPTSTTKIPEFSNAAPTLIVAALAATTLCAAAYPKKRRRV